MRNIRKIFAQQDNAYMNEVTEDKLNKLLISMVHQHF